MKTKKIFGVILALIIVVGLVSCADSTSIVGKWQYKGKDADIEAKQQEVARVIKEQYTIHNGAEQITLSLNEDNTYEITTPEEYNDNGTYTYQNGILTMSSELYGGNIELIVTITGNTLKLGTDITKHPEAIYPPIDLEETGITKYIEYEVYERIK